MNFGLSDGTIDKINQVFAIFSEIDQVVLYGSRAKGNFRPGSDIDLVMIGATLDRQTCAVIAEKLDGLLLPYSIDLSVFHLLKHAALEAHIERVGKVFYQRES